MSDDAMARAFLENEGRKLPPRASKDKPSSKRKNLRRVSASQQADTDITTGIMAERVTRAIRVDGYFACECNKVPGHEHRDCGITWTVASEALEEAHPHHHPKRRKGAKANRLNVLTSRSAPHKLFILSPPCHDDVENNSPIWSKSA